MREFIVRVTDQEEIQWYEEEPEIPELVRCKDCKYWYQLVGDRGHCEIFNLSNDGDLFTDGDWYCADGKRKDGDKE